MSEPANGRGERAIVEPASRAVFREQAIDVLAAVPRSHPDLGRCWLTASTRTYAAALGAELATLWPRLRDGVIASGALLAGRYGAPPYVEMAVLARDACLLGYGLALALGPAAAACVRFVNISRRSLVDPALGRYLAQEGLDAPAFAARARRGEKVLLLDSGFKMSIGKALAARAGAAGAGAVAFHLARSMDPAIPQLRTLGIGFYPLLGDDDLNVLVKLMAACPKSTTRACGYEAIDGRWLAASAGAADADDLASVVSAVELAKMLEDLAAAAARPRERALAALIRAAASTATAAAARGDERAATNALRGWLTAAPRLGLEGDQAAVVVADWLASVALSPVGRSAELRLCGVDYGLTAPAPAAIAGA